MAETFDVPLRLHGFFYGGGSVFHSGCHFIAPFVKCRVFPLTFRMGKHVLDGIPDTLVRPYGGGKAGNQSL